MWDLGGQTAIRPYWRCYYQNTNGIIYVVDSADTQRLGVSKEELHSMMAVYNFFGVIFPLILICHLGRRVKRRFLISFSK